MNSTGSNHTYIVRVSKSICEFSPDGTLVATSFQNKLTVRNIDTLDIFRTYICTEFIEYIEWSPDSCYILCTSHRHNIVQAFSIQNVNWKCKLQDAESEFVQTFWSPDSRHILTVAQFQVFICVWSLISHSVIYIECTKVDAKPYFSFSPDGKFLAVVGDRGNLDGISVYSTMTWKLKRQISCIGMNRVGGISWTPDCTAICAWEREPKSCQVQVYEAETGQVIGSCKPTESKITGIKTISWAPSGQFLALACLDYKVRLLNHISWQPFMNLSHSDVIYDTDCKVYKETSITMHNRTRVTFHLIMKRPVTISSLPRTTDGVGVGLLAFSFCGQLFAARVDCMPAIVWIWSIVQMKLISIVIYSQRVTAFSWDPVEPKLAIVSDSDFVGLWSSHSMSVYMVDELCISDVRWHPTGKNLALCSVTNIGFISSAAM